MSTDDAETGLVPAFHADPDHDPIDLVSTTKRDGRVAIYDPDYEATGDEWLLSDIAVRIKDCQ